MCEYKRKKKSERQKFSVLETFITRFLLRLIYEFIKIELAVVGIDLTTHTLNYIENKVALHCFFFLLSFVFVVVVIAVSTLATKW